MAKKERSAQERGLEGFHWANHFYDKFQPRGVVLSGLAATAAAIAVRTAVRHRTEMGRRMDAFDDQMTLLESEQVGDFRHAVARRIAASLILPLAYENEPYRLTRGEVRQRVQPKRTDEFNHTIDEMRDRQIIAEETELDGPATLRINPLVAITLSERSGKYPKLMQSIHEMSHTGQFSLADMRQHPILADVSSKLTGQEYPGSL